VTLVPNGFDARTVRPASKDERDALRRRHGFRPDERIAVFLGSDVPPNRQAAEFILRRLAPATRGQPLRHVIAGRVAEHLSHAPDNVQLLGALPETLTLLQAADLGLNPIATGSGSNIKLAEYCAAGLGVVTTPFGLRGLEGLRPLVRVAALEDFPAAVLDARHPDRLPPAEILEPYAWQTGARRLEAFYRELIGGASGQRTMTVAGRAAVDGLG
jgi:glycosyltransferase involved in cell wall biosynthesis